MSRLLAALLGLGLSAPAFAGGYLAGSLQGSPSPAASITVGMPAVRLGFGNGSFAAFGGLTGARARLADRENDPQFDLVLWGVQPMLGVRGRVGKNPAEAVVNPVVTAGTYTRIFGMGSDDPNLEVPEQDEGGSLRPVVGGLVGAGLDARVSTNLSLSAEVGVDAFTAGYLYDNWVSQGSSLSTWSAVTVHIWL